MRLNEYLDYKLIFHPDAFVNGLLKGNKKGDTIEIVKTWKVGNLKYYKIAIKNTSYDGTPLKYNYLIDEHYRFLDYEGCNSEEKKKLIKENEIIFDKN